MLLYENFIKKYKLIETINNPNLSIVVPGGCNAHCDFCFWNKTKINENYFEKLNETINNLPKQFYQLSLTGGEPTISPYFKDILKSINTNKYHHTVLTTNGTKLLEHINDLNGIIKHVNISRHHYDDEINESIFKTKTVPNKEKLKKICNELNNIGIDVTISTVLTENFKSKKDTDKMIDFAKEIGAKSVFFRKKHGKDITKTKLEESYSNFPYVRNSNCPVCRTDEQLINGMKVSWKASMEEPSDELGYIYEVIFNENGILTSDWKMNNIIDYKLIKEKTEYDSKLFESCGGGGYSCGGYTTSNDENLRNKKQYKNEIFLIEKLKKGDKIKCIKNFKDKFIIGEEYEFIDLDLENNKISIKYIKYKDKNNNIIKLKDINQFDSIIKVNVIFRMNISTFLDFFDIYKTIKPDINDDEFEWDWED